MQPVLDLNAESLNHTYIQTYIHTYIHHHLPINVPTARHRPSLWITHKDNGPWLYIGTIMFLLIIHTSTLKKIPEPEPGPFCFRSQRHSHLGITDYTIKS
jgi:hypothetical protein